MLESELQSNVLDLVRVLGGTGYHTHDSRRSAAGFPDLVIVFGRPGGLLFAELKSRAGKATTDQLVWLDRLRAAGAAAYLWRPDDWHDGTIAAVLTAAAGRRLAR